MPGWTGDGGGITLSGFDAFQLGGNYVRTARRV